MCMPYTISQSPPPKKRPKSSKPLIRPISPRRASKVQPAFIEISPRLTYIASPKSKRSPVPHKVHPHSPKPRQSSEVEVWGGFATGEETCKQAEGRVTDQEDQQPAKAAVQKPPSEHPPAAVPQPPPPAPTPPTPSNQCQPKDPTPPPPNPLPAHDRPPPASSAPEKSQCDSQTTSAARDLPSHSTRSPHSYTRRPPPHSQSNRRSRSLSSDSSASKRSIERLKRNLHVLWERLRALERWKEEREDSERMRRSRSRRRWELGYERRDREIEIGYRGRDAEVGRLRYGKIDNSGRGDWEGGRLGRR